jgi:REP element-mobilizing transposase RayT
MVRQRRIYCSNAVYHVVFRDNNRQFILDDNIDKEVLLKYRPRFATKKNGGAIE